MLYTLYFSLLYFTDLSDPDRACSQALDKALSLSFWKRMSFTFSFLSFQTTFLKCTAGVGGTYGKSRFEIIQAPALGI